MGLSERQEAIIAKYRAENPRREGEFLEEIEEQVKRQSEERAKEREARAELMKARKALQEAVAKRTGWQYDPRNGDAWVTIRPLVGQDPKVGCIAYVRAKPEGGGYESIVKGNRVGLGLWPFTDNMSDPTEALKTVEKWLQEGLERIAVEREFKETCEAFQQFLVAELGHDAGVDMYAKFLHSKF